ncbi:MAG: serine hydrolase domain-containing protein [Bacteroidota bacterium]
MKNHPPFYLVFVLLLLITSCDPQDQQSDQELATKVEQQIENDLTLNLQFEGDPVEKYTLKDRMAHYNVPGLSLAVIKNGEVLFAKGYGVANTETNAMVDEETLFQAGSISKPVAALAALKLIEEGKMGLDTDINDHLTSWKVPESRFLQEEKVTIRRLLTHTAGMTVHGFPGYTQTDTFPSDVEVLNGEGNTGAIFVDTVPGVINRYSGGGYTVMERAVEDQSGMDFASYMMEHILEPLGMSRSTYEQPIGAQWSNISAAFDGGGNQYPGAWHNYPEQAAAGLWTTPTDLAKYMIAIQNTMVGNSNPVLSRDMVEKMLTKDPLGHGLGPGVRLAGDSLMFGHGGKNAGFTNNMNAWAYRGEGIIVMTSADRGRGLVREIERAVSEVMNWDLSPARIEKSIELSSEEISNRVGIYEWKARNFKVEVKLEDGQMVLMDLSSGARYPVRALDELRVIDTVDGDVLSFEKNADGSIAGFMQSGRYRFEKID